MIKNVKDIVVFLTRKAVISVSFFHCFLEVIKVIFAEKPHIKINSLKKQKHWYLIHTWSDKTFKGTVVNRTLPSLHAGSLEIKRTVYLKKKSYFLNNALCIVYVYAVWSNICEKVLNWVIYSCRISSSLTIMDRCGSDYKEKSEENTKYLKEFWFQIILPI